MKKLVPSDIDALKRWLAQEERELTLSLAALEAQVREFEDREKPAYDQWVRLEFGPELQTLEEVLQRIRERRLRVDRIQELIETEGLAAREALYVVLHPEKRSAAETRKEDEAFDRDARRRAKLDAKRSARKEAKKEAKQSRRPPAESGAPAPEAPGQAAQRSRVVALYRVLARRLHPDSGEALRGPRAQALWLDVQSAYEASSLDRLLAIAAWIETESPVEHESATAREAFAARSLSERSDGVRSMRKSLRQLERRLAQLASDPAWGFGSARGSERKKLRRAVARQIEDEIAGAQAALEAIEDLIESIGPPKPPGRRAAR